MVRIILQSNELASGLIWDIEQRMVTWFGILAILSIGKKYLNKSNAVTTYLSKAAFPLYYFHQSVLVALGYFVLRYVNIVWMQFSIIMIGSFIISIMCYEVFRRFKVSSFLFGIKCIK
jgi:peptidoglycan/LPS O-acetylase OafA/YrhL